MLQEQVAKQQQAMSGRPDEKLQQTMTLTIKRLDQYIQVRSVDDDSNNKKIRPIYTGTISRL